jgi:hypothetical protein
MARPRDREGVVEEHPRPRHDPRAAPPVIATGGRQRAHRVGAVKRVVKAPPARIGGVQRKARIGDRHHELRPRHRGDLGVDLRGLDAEIPALGHEVADLLQERLVAVAVMGLPLARAVPVVDLRLKRRAPLQKRAVFRREVMQQFREPRPEGAGLTPVPGSARFSMKSASSTRPSTRRAPRVPPWRPPSTLVHATVFKTSG